MKKNEFTVFDCSIFELPKIADRTGNLTAIQNNIEVPFEIKRVYYLYDVPGGESRGAHGHRKLEQFIIAASGSFDVTLDDGHNRKTVNLNRPYMGLHIRPGMWRDLYNFSSGAISLVLASELFEEDDYIRDYKKFLEYRNPLQKIF